MQYDRCMGSLENALQLARTVGETVTKVQGPMDVHLMAPHITTKCDELQKQGPYDQWWGGVRGVYDDCMKHAPQKCITLAEYAQWAEHMVRFWHTVLSARAMIVAWAGRDPTSQETKISPNTDLIRARDLNISTDFPKGQPSKIETIGNETIETMQKRGIDCFDPWTSAQYRSRFSLASHRKQVKVLHNERDSALLCGFYFFDRRTPQPPPSAAPKDRVIGKETLRTRTLWPAEIVPLRIGFRSTAGGTGLTSVNEYEAALRIALDLMKISTDAKLPLVLPEKRKAP